MLQRSGDQSRLVEVSSGDCVESCFVKVSSDRCTCSRLLSVAPTTQVFENGTTSVGQSNTPSRGDSASSEVETMMGRVAVRLHVVISICVVVGTGRYVEVCLNRACGSLLPVPVESCDPGIGAALTHFKLIAPGNLRLRSQDTCEMFVGILLAGQGSCE